MRQYVIKTCYSFTPQEESQLEALRTRLEAAAQMHNVIGLVILGKEGFNSTLTSTDETALDTFIEELKAILKIQESPLIKKSFSEKRPFRRFDVKIRAEIVTFEREDYVPKGEHRHLSPKDWNELIKKDDVVVIDTRNNYETKLGKFKKALDFNIEEFTEFADKLRTLETDREKPHLIYCTGGIRCEKAIYELEAQGFKNVYQLEGGILNYIEQFPNEEYEGECFVFDSRVAVDQELKPSQKFSLCPHCGDVSSEEITCVKCDSECKLCPKCLELAAQEKDLMTCSKNCRHHYKLRPDVKGPQQKLFYHE
jgi:UPF0176 protein